MTDESYLVQLTSKVVHYVELTIEDFAAVEALDEAGHLNDSLHVKIASITGESVEYSGHYGPHIFYGVTADDDCEVNKAVVLETIWEHVLKARKRQNDQKSDPT